MKELEILLDCEKVNELDRDSLVKFLGEIGNYFIREIEGVPKCNIIIKDGERKFQYVLRIEEKNLNKLEEYIKKNPMISGYRTR